MRKRALLIVGLIALSALLGWTVYAQQRTPTRVAWEYRLIINPTEPQVNALGADGWEMVNLVISDSNQYMYFKRTR